MNNHYKPLVTTTLMVAASITLAACSTASREDDGQRISARGEAISARGQAWTDGQRDLQKGQKLVERGVDRTADGEKKLKRAQEAAAKAQLQIEQARAEQLKGEQLISAGNVQMQQAESAYAAIRSGPPAVSPE